MTSCSGKGEERRIFIDADGFPNIETVLEIAGEKNIDVFIVGNYTQNLGRFEGLEGVNIVEVSEGSDEADFAILTEITGGDILLTGDIGLASIALGKGAVVLDRKGAAFSSGTIDFRLHRRHEAKKARRGGGRTKGPGKMGADDGLKLGQRLKEEIDALLLK